MLKHNIYIFTQNVNKLYCWAFINNFYLKNRFYPILTQNALKVSSTTLTITYYYQFHYNVSTDTIYLSKLKSKVS